MNETVKMTLAAAVSLYDLLERILFSKGEEGVVERDLPFNIKYKLQRVINQLSRDYDYTSTKRTEFIKQLGVKEPDSDYIRVPEDKIGEFNEEMNKIYSIVVEHNFKKFTPEEVELLAVDGFNSQEIYLFASALVDDPELTAELDKQIGAEQPVAEEAPKEESKEEAPPIAEEK